MIYGTSRVYSSATCDVGKGPNITGKVADFNNRSIGINPSGAFYKSGTVSGAPGEWGGSGTRYSIEMDASQSSAFYGQGQTVQPATLLGLPCIKF